MLILHPEILKRDGKEQFAVLPYEEFLAIKELLEDVEDIRLIEEAKSADPGGAGLSLDEVKQQLGIE